MKTKLVLLFVLSFAWAFFCSAVFSPATTLVRSSAAVASVEHSNSAWVAQQAVETAAAWPVIWPPILFLASLIFCKDLLRLVRYIRRDMGPETPRTAAALAFAFLSLGLGGCIKKYNEPKFVDVGNNETAYIIPLQGDTTAQAKFDSVKFLDEKKVAAKRIQIPRGWVGNGYLPNSGYYQDTVRVVVVDRTPVTVEFHQDGTPNTKDADAIWVESKDSVGFSTGFSVTALIKEQDTSTFLYRYNAMSLKQVLAQEVRARIQQISARFAATYILDELRNRKNEMRDEISSDVIPFFADRGITITTIGQFGGMTYENVDIQKSIDNTFVAQQEKVVAAARLTAQNDINSRLESEKQQAKRNAILLAEGEAAAITLVAKAAQEAASNPAFVRLRELEVETKRVEKWNGVTPTTLIEGHPTGMNMFVTPK